MWSTAEHGLGGLGALSCLDFQTLLDQHGRMLRIDTALPALALVPERMVAREAVCKRPAAAP